MILGKYLIVFTFEYLAEKIGISGGQARLCWVKLAVQVDIGSL
jgi:hypothetical protein